MTETNAAKTIICLAASRKPGGRCIAGKDVSDHAWIRPVSKGKDDSINNMQSGYWDGKLAQVLDIIEIPVIKFFPKQFQTENWLINEKNRWQKKGIFDKEDLDSLLENPPALWQNLDSTTYGENDRIPERYTNRINQSLFFIRANCTLIAKTEGTKFGNPKWRLRCSFTYKNDFFIIPVTDPIREDEYRKKTEGKYNIGERYICVSLGPIYEGCAYLFVAAII